MNIDSVTDNILNSSTGSGRVFLKSMNLDLPIHEKEFCHYTDLNGLKGIIENNEVWLSDHRFLNDTSEHSYGRELAIRVIDNAIQKESESEFLQILIKTLEMIRNMEESSVFYIASMSLGEDKLDLWKGYGSKSTIGICLVFNENFFTNSYSWSISLLRVIYVKEQQEERIEKILSIFKEEVSKKCEMSSEESSWESDLTTVVTKQFIQFKHSEYSSENEIRFVFEDIQRHLFNKTDSKIQIEHRISNGLIIPYLTSKSIVNYHSQNTTLSCDTQQVISCENYQAQNKPSEKKLPLEKVIVGTNSDSNRAIKSVKAFLKNTSQYADVEVCKSDIPFDFK